MLQRATRENTFYSNWCHPLKIKIIIIVNNNIVKLHRVHRTAQFFPVGFFLSSYSFLSLNPASKDATTWSLFYFIYKVIIIF